MEGSSCEWRYVNVLGSEVKEIIDLVSNGYKCTQFDNLDGFLYIRLEKDDDTKGFAFIKC